VWKIAALVGAGTLALAGSSGVQPVGATTAHPSHAIALIGDSISLGLAHDLHNPRLKTPAGVTWSISAQAGAGWGEVRNMQGDWPLGVVQGNWAGMPVQNDAAHGRPPVLAIELGTNDAARAGFAFVVDSPTDLSQRIQGTEDNIRAVVVRASLESPCVVLVTPSYYPTKIFGLETNYSAQAWIVRSELLDQARSIPHRYVVIADWGTLSLSHHTTSGGATSWFEADQLHFNLTGERALANLIVQTAATCS
jgi:hypothetical protein